MGSIDYDYIGKDYCRVGPTVAMSKRKVSKLLKFIRVIMMMCTGLCLAKAVILINPLIEMLPPALHESTPPALNIVTWWILIFAAIAVTVSIGVLVKIILCGIYNAIFGD